MTATQTHTHTDEPRLWKERGVCVCACARFWHFLSFSLTPSVVGFHSKTTFTDSPINRLPPTTNSHPLTNTHACTSPLYPFSIPHSFFPPKHTLSFRRFQKGTLNGSLSLLSSYRNWCYASNKVYHDFFTVSLSVFFKQTPSSMLNFLMLFKSFYLLFAILPLPFSPSITLFILFLLSFFGCDYIPFHF